MEGKNHSIFGFALATSVIAATWETKQFVDVPIEPLLLIVTSSAAAYKADLDLHGNASARKGFEPVFQVVKKTPILKKIFGHRGFTHTYLIPVLIYYVALALKPEPTNTIVIGLASLFIGSVIGYASHIFIDVFNGKGAPVLFPLPWRISVSSITSGKLQEKIFMAIVVLLTFINTYLIATGKVL